MLRPWLGLGKESDTVDGGRSAGLGRVLETVVRCGLELGVMWREDSELTDARLSHQVTTLP